MIATIVNAEHEWVERRDQIMLWTGPIIRSVHRIVNDGLEFGVFAVPRRSCQIALNILLLPGASDAVQEAIRQEAAGRMPGMPSW